MPRRLRCVRIDYTGHEQLRRARLEIVRDAASVSSSGLAVCLDHASGVHEAAPVLDRTAPVTATDTDAS